jgi:hypothetical protein
VVVNVVRVAGTGFRRVITCSRRDAHSSIEGFTGLPGFQDNPQPTAVLVLSKFRKIRSNFAVSQIITMDNSPLKRSQKINVSMRSVDTL